MAKRKCCVSCYKEPLSKDEIGMSIKLLGDEGDDWFCIDCLAAYLECEIQDILDKIEEFRDEGCELFQ